MRFASGNNLLDVTPASVYVVVTVSQGWCGSIQHAPAKIERVISRYCTNMAEAGLPARVEVRHG